MILKPFAAIFAAIIALCAMCSAQAPTHYEPTIESLDQHPLPQWYAGAKLGIFIHWGLYSVPGWAPVNHPDHDFSSSDYIKYNPYAEWYLNVLRISGSTRTTIPKSRRTSRPSSVTRRFPGCGSA